MAIVLVFTTVIFFDASEGSRSTLIAAAVKNTAEASLANLALTSNCAGSYLAGIRLSGNAVLLNFSGCAPALSQIANVVEQQICTATPNNDDTVNCGQDSYYLEAFL